MRPDKRSGKFIMIHRNGDPSDPMLPVGWFYFAVAPVLPFLLGTGVMQLFVPATSLDLDSALIRQSVAFSHLGGWLTYASAVCFQLATCAGAIFFHLICIRKLDVAVRRGAYRILIIALSFGIVVMALVWITKAAPYQLTYDVIRRLLLLSPGLPKHFASEGFFLGQSRMLYTAILPLAMGAGLVALAAAFGAALSVPDEVQRSDWEARFAERVLQLQSSFQASSLVLVTSTVALMLMVQLPVGLADESTREALSRFALGLTVYWSSIMTLTLFAVFVPPLVALRREASNHYRASGIEQTFGEWIGQRKYFSVKQHLTNLATMLAPVLVGPVGTLVESMLGS